MLESGTHTVYVSDGTHTCSDTLYFVNPDLLDMVFRVDSLVSCHGNDGMLSVDISGGTNVLQGYLTWWQNANGDTLNDIWTNNFALYMDGLSAGTYSVSVEDDHGCYYQETYTLGNTSPVQVSATAQSYLCPLSTTPITISATGGASYAPLSILVNGLPEAASYPAGSYTISAIDAKGCSATTTLVINNIPANNTTSSITACATYTWPITGNTYTQSGTYLHTTVNANGCIDTSFLWLTINNISNSTIYINRCDSYTWNGNTYTNSGVYTATMLTSAGCLQTETLYLTIRRSTTNNTAVSACFSYTWINGQTYTASGNYSFTTTNNEGCDSVCNLSLSLTNGVYVQVKALLSGAYVSSGLMQDSLRSRGLIPSLEPYSLDAGKFNPVGCQGYAGGETVSPAILSVTGENAIVDWVHIEIRSSSSPFSKIATKNALIQRDGDVVDVNGNPLYFACVCPGAYNVAIKHRNHLGIMTATAVTLSSTPVLVDFTNSNPVWTNPSIVNAPREVNGSYRLLWPGDTRTDKNTKYNGTNNDKEPILYAVGISTPNNIIQPVYRKEDANMDGRVKYNNVDNDKNFILNKILGTSPTATPNDNLYQHTPN